MFSGGGTQNVDGGWGRERASPARKATGTIAAACVAAVAAPLYAFGGPATLFGTTAALTAGALYLGVRLSHEAVPAEARVLRLPHLPVPVPA